MKIGRGGREAIQVEYNAFGRVADVRGVMVALFRCEMQGGSLVAE